MHLLNLFTKTHSHSRFINTVLISSSIYILYLLLTLVLTGSGPVPHPTTLPSLQEPVPGPTTVEHIVFGIASNRHSWPKRKDYVKLWYNNHTMRGCVFLDNEPDTAGPVHNETVGPPICISEDTSRFNYTNQGGLRSAIRVARVVVETVNLNRSNVRWFVFGDDDTVFFPENSVKTLSKYDHGMWYYIGTNSEIYDQNRVFGFGMAFGGAGFALSYPLAKVLAKVFDSCIARYPHLYGSDSRVYHCLTELGVSLTKEPGFHQFDVHGDAFGLLAAHPATPLVSLHHIDHINPIFPNKTRHKALQHLFAAASFDSQRILHQTVCYHHSFPWTISISWGYAVQIFPTRVSLPQLLRVQETFRQWKRGGVLAQTYTFNTRGHDPEPCKRPALFFLDNVGSVEGGTVTSSYVKFRENCEYDMRMKMEEVRVFSHKLELNLKQMRAPRRQCCEVLPSSGDRVTEIAVRDCREDELIYIH